MWLDYIVQILRLKRKCIAYHQWEYCQLFQFQQVYISCIHLWNNGWDETMNLIHFHISINLFQYWWGCDFSVNVCIRIKYMIYQNCIGCVCFVQSLSLGHSLSILCLHNLISSPCCIGFSLFEDLLPIVWGFYYVQYTI